ncbi:MAG: hypothetical protein KDE33_13485 [Bacteroidetes bacterium]|nr:hypothetical protein [Bacteroidota bacterium]
MTIEQKNIEKQFNALLMDLDLTDEQAENIMYLKIYVLEALRIHSVVGRSEQFYCLSDPSEGGVKRCKTQCRGCENIENARQ